MGSFKDNLGPIEVKRYAHVTRLFSGYRHLFEGKEVLDYGASYGLSAVVLIELGASSVIGIEVDAERVERGKREIARLGYSDRIQLIHWEDTTHMPFIADGQFDFITANAVFEHIAQPRRKHLQEVWRMLAEGGHFLLTETPNKYWPKDCHTTGLWFNNWLPKQIAHKRAVRLKKFNAKRTDWDSSGWRGLGYFEMRSALPRAKLVPELTRPRHHIFNALGVPSALFDPYPDWLMHKEPRSC